MGSPAKEHAIPLDAVECTTLAQWRRWLKANHTRPEGVWLVTYKQSASKPTLTYEESVCEALCWGWIDSTRRRVDGERSMLRFTPRNPRSGWSAPNKTRIAQLEREGRMQPAGRAVVAAAKANGTWSKLDAVEALEIPADLARAFRAHAGSRKQFEAFPRSVKRGILEWIGGAKKPETRAKRVEETARLAGEGKRANQWRAS